MDEFAPILDNQVGEGYKEKTFKTYRTQLIFYAQLIKDNFNIPVNRGYIVYTRSKNKLVEVPIQEKDFVELGKIIDEIVAIILNLKASFWKKADSFMTKNQLSKYCDAEFENIETVTAELCSVVESGKSEYSIAELAAIATFLHNIYNGVENILKRVLRANQVKVEDSPTWHKDMLKTSSNIEIISNDLYVDLSDYLSFYQERCL